MKKIEIRTKDQIITISEDNSIDIKTHINEDNKIGLIIKSIEGDFNYYSGSGDSSLKPIVMKTKAGADRSVKTIKLK